MTPDIINAILNVCGAIAVSYSIRRLLAAKMVRGVQWGTILFFMSWSSWNLYLYAHLNLWYSLFGGMTIVMAEAVYISLLFYYSRKEIRQI
jgi:hypothetical protein